MQAEQHTEPWSRIWRLRRFFQNTHARSIVIFNILFLYIWGYLLWGTADIGSGEWFVDECGHLLWPTFHMRILLRSCEHNHPIEFQLFRWKEEGMSWLLIIFLTVFLWEGVEFFHDQSGLFENVAQVGNGDTMADIFLSGVAAPLLVISYRRWKDGVSLLFTATRVKEANEQDWEIVYRALCRVAERTANNEPHMMAGLRELARKEWLQNHRVRPVIKMLYDVARGSRHERRRRRASMRKLKGYKAKIEKEV